MKANSTRVLLSLLLVSLFLVTRSYAQCSGQQPIAIDFSHLACNSSTVLMDFVHLPNSNGDDAIWVYDYTLPTNLSGNLNLKIKGGNGGDASIDCSGPVHRGNGGIGAFISGTVPVGDSLGMIPRGSTIRYVIGERGQSSLDVYTGDQYVRGGGGGGSSAVLYRAPNDSTWHILTIAGGGGGGAAECYPTIDYSLPIPFPVVYTAHEDGYPGGLSYLAEYYDSIDVNGNRIEVDCEDSWSSLPCYMLATVPRITVYTLNDNGGGLNLPGNGGNGGGGGGGLNGNGQAPPSCNNACSGGQSGQGWLNYPSGNTGPAVYAANVVSCAGTQSRAGGRGFSGGGAAYSHIGESGAGGGGGLEGGYSGGGSGPHFGRSLGGTSYIERSLFAPNWIEKVDTTGALDGYGNFNFTPTQASLAVQPILTAATTLAPPYCDGTQVTFVARPTYLNGNDATNFGNLDSNIPVYTWAVNGTEVATGQNFADSSAVINYQSGDVVTCQFWAKDSNGCERSATPIATVTLPERNDPTATSHIEMSVNPVGTICERRVYDQFGGYNLEAWATFKASAEFLPQAWDNGAGNYFYADATSSAQTMALRACEVEYGAGNCSLGSSQYFCTERAAVTFTDLMLSGAHDSSAVEGFPVGAIVTGESPCAGFSYYYQTGTSQTAPLPGARQFVFNGAPGVTTVNQDFSTKIVGGYGFLVSSYEYLGYTYYDTTFYSGYDTIMYTSRFGDTITGTYPFTRTLQSNQQWQLTTSNLGTIPYAGTTDYVPTYNWFLNGVLLGAQVSVSDGNGGSYTYTDPYTTDTMWIRYLHDGDVITCTASSNHCSTPDTSNNITIHVLPAANGGVISGPQHPCPGSLVTYEVTGATGVVDYLWTITGNVGNVTGTGNTRSFYVDSTDVQLTCIPAGQCGGGDTARFTISPSRIITGPCTSSSVIINGPSVRCQGQVVTLTPHSVGECYQWNNGATTASLSVIDDGEYFVYVNGCKSEVVTLTSQTPQHPTVSIAINPVQPGQETAWCRTNNFRSMSATVSNYTGSPNINYQWYRNGAPHSTQNGGLYLDLTQLNSYDTIQCKITLDEQCAIPVWSNKIVLPEISSNGPLGLGVNISAPQGCSGDTIKFTALPTNGGSNPTYTWRVNSTFASDTDAVYQRVWSNVDYPQTFTIYLTVFASPLTCRTGGDVKQISFNYTVYPKVTPAVNITAENTAICPGDSITYTATIENGGGAPVYEWYKNNTAVGLNNAVYTNAAVANGDSVYCLLANTDNTYCIAPPTKSNVLAAKVYTPLSPVTAATPSLICLNDSTNLSATLNPQSGDFTYEGFGSIFAPSQWTQNAGCMSYFTANTAPTAMDIEIVHPPYGPSFTTCYSDYSMVMPVSGTVSFDWSYRFTGSSAEDVPLVFVDGIEYRFPEIDYNNPQILNKTGHYSIAVNQGQTLKLSQKGVIYETANQSQFKGSITTFYNFKVQTQPSIEWYDALANGNLIGTGNTIAVTPTAAGVTNYYAEAANTGAGCGLRTPVIVTARPPSTTVKSMTMCGSYTWLDGVTYTASTNAPTHILTDQLGCDSILNLNLTILQPTTGIVTISACDSFTWIDGVTYTSSNNTATHIITNSLGCDSVVTLNLTIKMPTTGTDVISACESYTWIDGNTYTTSNNTATYTLTGTNGCDSLVTLNLTIKTPTAGTDVVSACESYTWIDGITYTASNNTATHTLTGSNGCDSVVTLNLTIKTPTAGTDVQTACESYTWIDGNTYTTSNSTATHTLTGSNGCDSVVTLNLTIKTPTTGTDVLSACESYTWIDGNTYTTSNSTARHTLTGSTGCDSVVTLNLTIKSPTRGTDVISACESYTWIDGNTYTASNSTATHTLTGGNGCDSVVILNLTIKSPTTGTDVISACGSYTWIDGNTYTTSNNTGTHTLTGSNGCDSVVTLNLTIKNPTTGTDVQTACESYTWIDGQTYTASNSTATHTLTGSNGCDSVVTLNLTINQPASSTINASICAGDAYSFNGINLTSAGVYADTLMSAKGCDSVLVLTLSVNQLPAPTITKSNDTLYTQTFTSYQWLLDGNALGFDNNMLVLSANGNYSVVVTDANGCSDTSSLLNVTGVSVEEATEVTRVTIFPNPNKGSFTVLFNNNNNNEYTVYITDALGRLIVSKNQVEQFYKFDLADQSAGIYFLHVLQGAHWQSFKVSVLK